MSSLALEASISEVEMGATLISWEQFNETRQWMGRMVAPIADAMNPKYLFFPAMTFLTGAELAGRLQGSAASWVKLAHSAKGEVANLTALFSLVAAKSLLLTKSEDLLPKHKDEHGHHHHHASLAHVSEHRREEYGFVKKVAGVFDDLSAFGNVGTRNLIGLFVTLSPAALGSLRFWNESMGCARNTISLIYHAGIAVADFATVTASSINKGALPTKNELYFLMKKDLAPLARYGTGVIQSAAYFGLLAVGPCCSPLTLSLALVNLGAATIMVYDGGGGSGGGGCC